MLFFDSRRNLVYRNKWFEILTDAFMLGYTTTSRKTGIVLVDDEISLGRSQYHSKESDGMAATQLIRKRERLERRLRIVEYDV